MTQDYPVPEFGWLTPTIDISEKGIMRKYLLIFAMLAIVLTACRIESNVNLDIEEDGSAVVLVEIGMDEEFRQAMTGQTGSTEEDFINEILSIGDTSLVQRTEGDMSYFGASQEIDDLSQGLPLDAANEMFASFDYSFNDDGASLSASVLSAESGGLGEFGDFGDIGAGLIDDIFSANVIVKMPGTVTSHNADEVRDDALVWNIPLSGSLDIQAESTFGDASTNWIWFALLVVIIVAGVAATIAVIVSRKQSEKAVAAAIAAYQAEDNRQQTTDHRPEAEGDDSDAAEDAELTDDDQVHDSPEDEPDESPDDDETSDDTGPKPDGDSDGSTSDDSESSDEDEVHSSPDDDPEED